VLAAGDARREDARHALGQLCEVYWYPLYAFLRRRGYSADDAQDLIQAFLTRLLDKNTVRLADPQRGKFRSFLLTALKNFLANERREARALKRGGGQAVLSFEVEAGESRYQLEPEDQRTPEDIFERRWAMTLLETSLARLRNEYADANKQDLYEALKDCLGGASAAPYKQVGQAIGMSEGSIKVAVHRLRSRYREILRDEIAQTVDDSEDVDEELRQMFNVLGR